MMATGFSRSYRILLVSVLLFAVPSTARSEEGQLPGYIKAPLQRCDQSYDRQEYALAATLCQGVAALIELRLGRNHVAMTVALTNLGMALQRLGRHAQAVPHLSRVLSILKQYMAPDELDFAIALNNLGLSLKELAKYDKAESMYRQALSIKMKRLGPDDPGVAISKNNVAALLMARGRYEQAEGLFKEALAADERHFGAVHATIATDLNNLAECYRRLARFKEAEPLYQRARDIIAATLGDSHPSMATNQGTFGLLRAAQGRYKEAEDLLRRALAITEQAVGRNHPHVANRLSSLADLLQQLSRYEGVLELRQRALKVSLAALGPRHPQVATMFGNLASLYEQKGKFAQALSLSRKALAIDAAVSGASHPDTAADYSNLAHIHFSRGKYAQSADLHRRALAAYRESLGEDHPEYATTLGNLSEVQRAQGLHEDAAKSGRDALAILTKSLGKTHPQVAGRLSRVAGIMLDMADYPEAERLLTRAEEILESTVGHYTEPMATVMSLQGELYLRLGQVERATQLMKRALEIDERVFGPIHVSLVTDYSNLSNALSDHQEDQSDRSAYELSLKALRLGEQLLGRQHPKLFGPVNHLGLALLRKRQFAEAEPLLQRAYGISVEAWGQDHPTVALCQNNLASLRVDQGRFKEAAKLQDRALAQITKRFSAQHPLAAIILSNSAALEVRQGLLTSAVSRLWRVVKLEESSLRLSSTDSRMAGLLLSYRGTEEGAYGMAFLNDERQDILGLALALSLLRKGAASDAGTSFNYALHHSLPNPEIRALFERWRRVRQEREFLLFSGPRTDAPGSYQARLLELRFLAEDLEQKLNLALPQLNLLKRHPPETIVKEVAAQLRPGEVLVEIAFAQPFRHRSGGGTVRETVPHYLALLLFPGGRLAAQDLGPAPLLDASISEFLDAAQNPNADPIGPAQALYHLSFAKLLPKLQGARRIYVSPDNAFHFVQFSALHDGTDYLLGKHQFLYLSSGRDLLRGPLRSSSAPPLLLAAPDFHATVFPRGKATPQASSLAGASLYQRLTEQTLLPGSEREARAIEPLLGVKALTGALATEQVVRTAQAPRILHIASHGVYLDDLPGTASEGTRISKLIRVGQAPLFPTATIGALSRSALLLAGVEHAAQAQDSGHDGLLTGSEVMDLNLWGTEIVVLSACETGKGILRQGEGVYGLRRAFLSAGAQSLVVSLWPIDDTVTEKFMFGYYSRLMRGEGKAAAIAEAMREIKDKKGHPYYWAPFLLIGRDEPLSWLKPNPSAVRR